MRKHLGALFLSTAFVLPVAAETLAVRVEGQKTDPKTAIATETNYTATIDKLFGYLKVSASHNTDRNESGDIGAEYLVMQDEVLTVAIGARSVEDKRFYNGRSPEVTGRVSTFYDQLRFEVVKDMDKHKGMLQTLSIALPSSVDWRELPYDDRLRRPFLEVSVTHNDNYLRKGRGFSHANARLRVPLNVIWPESEAWDIPLTVGYTHALEDGFESGLELAVGVQYTK
jgi:hypothetical protein